MTETVVRSHKEAIQQARDNLRDCVYHYLNMVLKDTGVFLNPHNEDRLRDFIGDIL